MNTKCSNLDELCFLMILSILHQKSAKKSINLTKMQKKKILRDIPGNLRRNPGTGKNIAISRKIPAANPISLYA